MAYFDENGLFHYGVIGMKWGVRKDRRSGNPRKRARAEEADRRASGSGGGAGGRRKPTPVEVKKSDAAAYKENYKRHLEKHGFTEADATPKKGWRPTRDQVTMIAWGVGIAALVGYGMYANYMDEKTVGNILLDHGPGESIGIDDFEVLKKHSMLKSWGITDNLTSGMIRPESFELPDIEIPAGHIFQRMSKVAETEFKATAATYATMDKLDGDRYLSAFKSELSTWTNPDNPLHMINFSAKESFKVASLQTTLNAMKKAKFDWDSEMVAEIAKTGKGNKDFKAEMWDDTKALTELRKYIGTAFDAGVLPKKMIDILKADGFGAMYDHMDAGVIGDRPLVLFDPAKLTEKVAKVITDDMVKEANDSLTEIKNRKL